MRKRAPYAKPMPPTMPPEQAASVRMFVAKIATAQSVLGQLDYQRALLEAQSVPIRAQLQRDAAEVDKMIAEAALAFGVDSATSTYDVATGAFSPKA